MYMDPPIINEGSFSAAAYSLGGIWAYGTGGTEVAELGLRMPGFGSCFVHQSTVTHHSASEAPRAGGTKRKDANSQKDSSNLLSTTTNNYLNNSNGKEMKGSEAKDDSSGAKIEAESSSKTWNKVTEESSKAEPPKDYIHVRAKRGQATDSHSLAERVRREKISERMRILQDLVPGCNKVIGKALVLDEIINYIQSLQRQVEILSMKLEAVNSRMNPTIESFPPKEMSSQAFDDTGIMFGSQPPREYVHDLQPEWLHMQIGSCYERAG